MKPIDLSEEALNMFLNLIWRNNPPKQLAEFGTLKAVIAYVVENPTPAFQACQFIFRVSR